MRNGGAGFWRLGINSEATASTRGDFAWRVKFAGNRIDADPSGNRNMRLTECHGPGRAQRPDGHRLSGLSGDVLEFDRCHSLPLVLGSASSSSASPARIPVTVMSGGSMIPLCLSLIDSMGVAGVNRFGHHGDRLGDEEAAVTRRMAA